MPPKLICPPPNGLPAGYRPAPPDPWPGRLLLPGAHGRHPRASQAPVGCPPPDASFFLLINSAAPIGKSVTMRGAAEGRASATAFLFFLQKQWELSPGTAARLIRIPARWAIRHIWRLPTRAWLRAYTTTSCQEDADSSTQSIGERCLLALHRPTTDPETKDIVQSMSEDGRSKPIAREGVRACMRADRFGAKTTPTDHNKLSPRLQCTVEEKIMRQCHRGPMSLQTMQAARPRQGRTESSGQAPWRPPWCHAQCRCPRRRRRLRVRGSRGSPCPPQWLHPRQAACVPSGLRHARRARRTDLRTPPQTPTHTHTHPGGRGTTPMRRRHAGGLRHDPSVVVSGRGTSLGTGDGQASARGRAAHGARERFPLRRAKPRGDLRTYVSWRVVATMLPPPLLC